MRAKPWDVCRTGSFKIDDFSECARNLGTCGVRNSIPLQINMFWRGVGSRRVDHSRELRGLRWRTTRRAHILWISLTDSSTRKIARHRFIAGAGYGPISDRSIAVEALLKWPG
jgi:hypothetical protein